MVADVASGPQNAIVNGRCLAALSRRLKAKNMGSLSPVHWLIVIVIVLLVFGPGRLAGVGKGLGEGIRQFKKGLNEDPEADNAPKPQITEKKPEPPAPSTGA